jgi:hypothetical protein
MSAAIILPILSEGRMAFAAVGQLVPAATATGNELSRILPPALVVALDRIGDQMGEEIFDPLLHAASVEQLARTFERVFPKFRDYYASTIFIVWGWLQEDPQRFSALTIRSFQESEHLIRSHGPHWIGQDASLNALHGLATITRIAKAVAVLLEKQGPADLRPNERGAEAWANALIAYVMAFSAVRASLAALADGRTPSAKLENVAALANWSKSYAVNAYHLAKVAGLLKTVRPSAPVGRSDEEDLVLAEAGLDSYAEGLAQDDRP